MTEVTERLPARMRNRGAKLYQKAHGNMVKFVLTLEKSGYRGFIYVKDAEGSETSIQDFYANYYYENNIQKIAHT